MKKQIVCFLLALIMVLGMIPNAAITANAYSVRDTSEKAIAILSGSETFYAKAEGGVVGYSTPTSYEGAKNYINGITKEDAVDLMHDYINDVVDEDINAFVKSLNIDLTSYEHDALAVHYYRTEGDISTLKETVRQIKTVNSAADRAAMVQAFVESYTHDYTSNEALRPTLDVSLAEAAMYLYGDYGYNGGTRLAFARLDTDHDFEGDAVAAYVKNDGYTLNPVGDDFLGWFLYDEEEEDITGAPLTTLAAKHNGELIVAKQATGDNDPAKYTLKTSTLADLNVYTYNGEPEQTGKVLKKNSNFKVTLEFLDDDGIKWVYGSGTTTAGKAVKGWVKVGKAEATEPETNKPIASATVISNTLNIRPGATTSGNTPLGQLKKGDVVNIYEMKVEKTETGNQTWGKVVDVETTDGDIVTGWINLAYTDVNETLGEDAEATGQTGVIANAEEVNVRSSAGITADNKICALKQGTKVTVLEMNSDRTWAKIKWTTPVKGYTQGWVYMHYVHLDSAPDGTTGAAGEGNVLYTGVVTSNINLNVRKSADIYAAKVGSLPYGTKVNIYELKTSRNMEWGRIGTDRWVCTSYLNLTKVQSTTSSGTSTSTDIQGTVTSATLDILKNYNNNSEKIGSLKKGDVVIILEKNTETTETGSRIWGRIQKDGVEGWINLAYVDLKNVTSVNGTTGGTTSGTTNSNGANAVIANCLSVNVRDGAGVYNAQITKLNNGTPIQVYNQVTKDNAPWAKITWNNGANEGWVCMYYVEMSSGTVGSTDENGVINGTNSNTISATGYVNSNIALNVRSGAGLGYAKVGSLNNGAKVTVYEQVSADGMIWGRIPYGTGSGWVCMSYINVESASSTGKGVMGTIARCFAAVNVRSAPGTGNALVNKIAVGTRVEVFETKTYSGQLWGRVAQGWICMDYVLLDSELPEGTILDATEPTTEATQGGDNSTDATINRDNEVLYTITGTVNTADGGALNVRNDADADSIRVGTVNNGLSLNVLAVKNNGAQLWGRIDQHATAGWVCMDYVNYSVVGYVNTEDQPVYADADTSSTVKATLSINTKLTITKLTVGGETVYGWVDSASAWIPMGRISNDPVDVIPTYKKYTHNFDDGDLFVGATNAACSAVSAVNGSEVVFHLQAGVKVPVGSVKIEAGKVWAEVIAHDVIGWINLANVNFTVVGNVEGDILNVRSTKSTADETNILGSVDSTVELCELSFDSNGNLWGKVTGYTDNSGVAVRNGGYVMVKAASGTTYVSGILSY